MRGTFLERQIWIEKQLIRLVFLAGGNSRRFAFFDAGGSLGDS
jgi:hypothetical protein